MSYELCLQSNLYRNIVIAKPMFSFNMLCLNKLVCIIYNCTNVPETITFFQWMYQINANLVLCLERDRNVVQGYIIFCNLYVFTCWHTSMYLIISEVCFKMCGKYHLTTTIFPILTLSKGPLRILDCCKMPILSLHVFMISSCHTLSDTTFTSLNESIHIEINRNMRTHYVLLIPKN